MRIVTMLLLLCISYTSFGEDEVSTTAAMCAAVTYSAVTNSEPDVKDVLYERGGWWLQYTTTVEVDQYLDMVIETIAESIDAGRSEEVTALLKLAVVSCEELRMEIIAELEKAQREEMTHDSTVRHND